MDAIPCVALATFSLVQEPRPEMQPTGSMTAARHLPANHPLRQPPSARSSGYREYPMDVRASWPEHPDGVLF